MHRRPRRSKVALTRSVQQANKTRRFGGRVMRQCGSKNTSTRMNRSRPRDRRTRDRLLRAHDSDGTVCVVRNPPAHHPPLWIGTIAGGAWSPAVAATGRTVGGLSEGRAGKQRDQRESSKKHFHHTSPELTEGLSVVPAIAAGRRPVPCSCCPSPFVDRVEWAFIPKQRPRTHVNSTRDYDCSRSLQILRQPISD